MADRDANAAEKAALAEQRDREKRRTAFAIVQEQEVVFNEVLASVCRGGRMQAVAKAEEADKTAQPRCAWWRLQGDAAPLAGEDAAKGRLDLVRLADQVAQAYILVAEVHGSGGPRVREHDADLVHSSMHAQKPWNVVLKEVHDQKLEEVLRLRRPGGVEFGHIWVVGILLRTGTDKDRGWKMQAINEVYPAKRLSALLPLRCKELVPEFVADETAAQEEKELSPGEQARRMLEEAMREGMS